MNCWRGGSVDEAVSSGALASQHARLVRALLPVTHGGARSRRQASVDAGSRHGAGARPRGVPCPHAASAVARGRPFLLTRACSQARRWRQRCSSPAAAWTSCDRSTVRAPYRGSTTNRVAQAVLFLAGQTRVETRRAPCAFWRSARARARRRSRSLDALARAGVEVRVPGTPTSGTSWSTRPKPVSAPEYPNLRFAFLDVETDPAAQGLARRIRRRHCHQCPARHSAI